MSICLYCRRPLHRGTCSAWWRAHPDARARLSASRIGKGTGRRARYIIKRRALKLGTPLQQRARVLIDELLSVWAAPVHDHEREAYILGELRSLLKQVPRENGSAREEREQHDESDECDGAGSVHDGQHGTARLTGG